MISKFLSPNWFVLNFSKPIHCTKHMVGLSICNESLKRWYMYLQYVYLISITLKLSFVSIVKKDIYIYCHNWVIWISKNLAAGCPFERNFFCGLVNNYNLSIDCHFTLSFSGLNSYFFSLLLERVCIASCLHIWFTALPFQFVTLDFPTGHHIQLWANFCTSCNIFITGGDNRCR